MIKIILLHKGFEFIYKKTLLQNRDIDKEYTLSLMSYLSYTN